MKKKTKKVGKARKVKMVKMAGMARMVGGKKAKVALGLSGGVDSAVAAYLLKKNGFDVHCVYLNCFDIDTPGCRGDNDRKDALAVAMHLGLPFQVLDFRKEYQAAVIDYFKKEYLAGRTPNPDVVCNRDIKFGLFLDWSIKAGFDYVATGHYADGPNFSERKIEGTPAPANDRSMPARQSLALQAPAGGSRERIIREVGEWQAKAGATVLRIPKDLHKDQTYFLWAIPRDKFERVLFPLGNYLKSEVREIAGLLAPLRGVAKKKDSTGICFVGEVRVEEFLKSLGVKEREGEVVLRRSVIGSPFSVFGSKSIGFQSASSKPVNRKLTNQNLKTDNRKPITEDIVVGSHRGVWFYTIGQRHGFEITRWPPDPSPRAQSRGPASEASDINIANARFPRLQSPSATADGGQVDSARNDGTTDRPPLYIISKDVKTNRLIVGFGAETYRSQFVVSQTNWLISNFKFPARLRMDDLPDQTSSVRSQAGVQAGGQISNFPHAYVRIRHGGDLIQCSVIGSQFSVFGSKFTGLRSISPKPTNRQPINHKQKTENRKQITVVLSTPQRGIAPGQSAVFYSKEGIVLGGGVIQP